MVVLSINERFRISLFTRSGMVAKISDGSQDLRTRSLKFPELVMSCICATKKSDVRYHLRRANVSFTARNVTVSFVAQGFHKSFLAISMRTYKQWQAQ